MKTTRIAQSKMFLSFIAAAAACMSVISVSVAQERRHPASDQGGEQREHRACAEDIKKFCSNVQPGEGRIIECLNKNENELSSGCKAEVENRKQRFEADKKACEGDVKQFCNDVQPGGGRIINCLKQHENELSPSCKNAFAQKKQGR